MKIKVNDDWINLALDEYNLAQVLEKLGYLNNQAGEFVVAHNQTLVSRDDYPNVAVKDQDSLDILGVITGG
ncbi:MAG: sulfur carrier protein ThiS [Venatoribacter sp.]